MFNCFFKELPFQENRPNEKNSIIYEFEKHKKGYESFYVLFDKELYLSSYAHLEASNMMQSIF